MTSESKAQIMTLTGHAVNSDTCIDGIPAKVFRLTSDAKSKALAARTIVWALCNGCTVTLTEPK